LVGFLGVGSVTSLKIGFNSMFTLHIPWGWKLLYVYKV
jgi:hypothetical protein